jgi:hypothetical protein
VPLAVVSDLGSLLARADLRRRPLRPGTRAPGDRALHELYGGLLEKVARCESLTALDEAAPRDEIFIALLARVLGPVVAGDDEAAMALVPALPLSSPILDREPAALAREHRTDWAVPFLQRLVAQAPSVLVRIEQVELGLVRLLGLYPGGASGADLADLVKAMSTSGTGSVADFVLQLLPSLLETKRSAASQRFAVDGYASVERKGNLDALLPSELAHEPEVFELKALSDDLLYYGHERPAEGARPVHGILVDASASMRGSREILARGIALALAKALALRGAEVWLSFFDSRLHRRVDIGALAGKEIPYLLSFRSERGRNYARAFADLRAELERLQRLRHRTSAITFLTHAECHIPVATVEALARLTSLRGVFVLPSQPLAIGYLQHLASHQVIHAETVAAPAERRRRALEVIGRVTGSGGDS